MITLTAPAGRAAQPKSQPDPAIEPNVRALFDQPTEFVRTVLPPRPGDPNPLGVVRCSYYPAFTVKELDYGDHGDAAIYVTPASAGAARPKCGKQNDRGEIVLPNGEAGYLIGVKEAFVYIESTMGAETSPFAIYDGRTGKKLYGDQSSDHGPKQLSVGDGVLNAEVRSWCTGRLFHSDGRPDMLGSVRPRSAPAPGNCKTAATYFGLRGGIRGFNWVVT